MPFEKDIINYHSDKIIKDVFRKTRGRFSVISYLRASHIDGMTEKRPLVLMKTSLIT